MISTTVALNLLFSLTLTEVTPTSLHFSCLRNESADNICYAINSNNTSNMELIYEFNSPYLVKNSTSGYAYLDLTVYKLPYTEASNLYVLNYKASYTPGFVARNNGETINGQQYDNVTLKSGYLHVSAEKMNQGYRYSGNITPKATWPTSSDFVTTFMSSYGESSTIGSSVSISIGEGGSIFPNVEGTVETSCTMSFDVSVSSVCDDPVLSMQNSPSNSAQAQWNFETIGSVAGKVTYHLNSFYLFEMDKTASNCSSDAFHATVGMRFTVVDDYGNKTMVSCPTSTYAFFY